MNLSIDLVASGQSLSVEIRQAVVLDSDHEVFPHKLNCPFYFFFGLSTVWAAQDGLESIESRKVLKLAVKGAVFLFQQPLDYYLFHVVVQDLFRIPTKIPKCVLVTPERALVLTSVTNSMYLIRKQPSIIRKQYSFFHFPSSYTV